MNATKIDDVSSESAETRRLFVAVFPSPEVSRRLAEAIPAVAQSISPGAVAWTREEQLHLTLFFLGSVPRAKVGEIEQALEDAGEHGKRHTLRARGLGCFPNANRPRILWAGLGGDLAPLESLKQALDKSLGSLGYAPDARPFHPHLTLGRVKLLTARDRRHLASVLPQWRETDFGQWQVDRLDLMRSVLSPAGSRYERLRSFPLSRSAAKILPSLD